MGNIEKNIAGRSGRGKGKRGNFRDALKIIKLSDILVVTYILKGVH